MDELPDRPLRDVIADAVRGQILAGALSAGSRIREERLAADHGVSRVPVREALQRLEQEGYLVLTPRRGATVASPSPGRALELMAIRRTLEVLAAQLAAERRAGRHAAELQSLVAAGTKAVRGKDLDQLPELIEQFHDLVAVASGNGELAELLAQLRSRVRWMFEVDLAERQQEAWADHAAIVEAILAGDTGLAGRRMDEHVAHDERDYRRKASRQTG
jgi:DNA-binding GntR family transcriptional regulator